MTLEPKKNLHSQENKIEKSKKEKSHATHKDRTVSPDPTPRIPHTPFMTLLTISYLSKDLTSDDYLRQRGI